MTLSPGPRSSRSRRLAQRAAAVAALAAVVLLGLIVLGVIVDELDKLVIAFVFLFFVVSVGWLALTRRGVIRLAGIGSFALALVVLIAQLGWYGAEVVALVVGALAAYGMAGRFATRATSSDRPAYRRVARAVRGVLLINPRSGGGKAARFRLAEEARSRGLEPVVLRPGDDLRELARCAIARGADVIGMAGGDGSQAIVASVAMEHGVAHVCIPAGTRNHFALDLGLDRDDVVGSLEAFSDGVERRIDLAHVNGHVFVNNASLGLYAHVVQSDCYRSAKLATWRRMLPDLVAREASSIDLQFEDAAGTTWRDAVVVLVSNNPYQVTRFVGAGTRPRLDMGRLGIVATRVRGAGAAARLVMLTTVGQVKRARRVREWSSQEFVIRSRAPVPVGLDGERFVLEPPLRFGSLPGALRVRLPRHASGVSPAEASFPLTTRNVVRLVQVVGGREP